MKVQRCKGCRDLSPAEMRRFRFVERVFRECCRGWGFNEIKTPTLEYLHLFTAAGTLTPGMLSKVYSFLDWDGWSGQRVVLKPDGTIPVARFYIDSLGGEGLARLYYVTGIFRFEATGSEARESWQGGVELIGAGSPLTDLELITMALDVLTKAGIKDVELRLSHAGLIRSLLSWLKLSPKEQAQVLDQVLDGDTEALARIRAEKPGLSRALKSLLGLEGESSGVLRNVKALFNHSLPELEPQIDNLISIVDLIEAMGYRYRIDISSGRGFEYYTGIIYQLYRGEDKLGGGGRYDALIPLLGGKDIPASGFALYFDRIADLITPATLPEPAVRKVLIKTGAGSVKPGFDIARRLHEAGYVAELAIEGQASADFDWLVEVRDEVPLISLTDRIGRREFKLETADEVLKLLGEGTIAEDSLT